MSTRFESHINETVAALPPDPVAVGAALIRERAVEARFQAKQIRTKAAPDETRLLAFAEELELRAARLDGVAQQWGMRAKKNA